MENYYNNQEIFTTRDYIEHYTKVGSIKLAGLVLILSSVLFITWSVSQLVDDPNLNKTFLKKIIDNKVFSIILIVLSSLTGYAAIAAGIALITVKQNYFF